MRCKGMKKEEIIKYIMNYKFMTIMKKLTFLLLLAMVSASGMAQKFTVKNDSGNEIMYEVLSATDKTVSVTGRKDKLPDLIIPSTVSYEGASYSVVEISNMNASSKIEKLQLPSTLKKIGDEAFAGFRAESLSIPEGVVEIGYHAFMSYKLSRVSIPSSVRKIGTNAFSRNARMKGEFVFDHLPLYVNEHNCEEMGIRIGSVAAYYAEHPQTNTQPQVVYAQTPAQVGQTAPAVQEQPKPSSDVDINLPQNAATNENTFAVIFANENSQEEVKVEYALNDGEMFSQYCHKVLGLPEDNIHLRKDATLNNMRKEIEWITKVAQAYDGNARVIVYYAGHGIPDEKSGTSYLLPVDGSGSSLSTGYSLASLYKTLGELPVQDVMVFMDACFSGAKRGEGMLASARGVAIKAKPEAPKGKMIVFSAAQGDETAYPLTEKGHGLFTYFLLKKLQETKGDVSLQELGNYVTEQVKRKSIVSNGKSQTPTIVPSAGIGDTWQNMKLK